MTLKPTRPSADLARAEQAIAKLALAYPDVQEQHPWGHRAFKVKNKTFLFLGADAEGLGLSVKLPESGALALELRFTEPTHYGLGKSGWVSARFRPGEKVPMDAVASWIDESFRAIAPKRLVGAMSSEAPARAAGRAGRPAAKKKTARARESR